MRRGLIIVFFILVIPINSYCSNLISDKLHLELYKEYGLVTDEQYNLLFSLIGNDEFWAKLNDKTYFGVKGQKKLFEFENEWRYRQNRYNDLNRKIDENIKKNGKL
jgi:hypothetical protein